MILDVKTLDCATFVTDEGRLSSPRTLHRSPRPAHPGRGLRHVREVVAMMITARIGAIEVEIDDDDPGIHGSPEYLEDISRRLGRQALEIYNGIPDKSPQS